MFNANNPNQPAPQSRVNRLLGNIENLQNCTDFQKNTVSIVVSNFSLPSERLRTLRTNGSPILSQVNDELVIRFREQIINVSVELIHEIAVIVSQCLYDE